jgi:tripartite-type tricarboxylate transporter receptor subunit TctC
MFPIRRRGLLKCMAAGASVLATHALAAQAWPTRTVRIIVPFAPGGGADSSARVLGDLLAPRLGQAVIVENKPGAGSAIGVVAAAQARDGHTLLMASNSMVINPSLTPQIGYDPVRDFDAVGMVSEQPLVLVVPANSAARSLPDLLALAKAKGDLTAGNSGNGTLAHIASEIFAGQAGLHITPVAYKGESALLPEMISGLVDFGFLNLPSVAPHLKSGRLRALAVSAPQPVPDLPGVPTLRSLNYPALEVQGWAALLAPKGTIPAEGLNQLSTLLMDALASETVKTRFAALAVSPVVMSRQASGKFLEAEAARYAGVIRARGIKAG